MRSNEEIAHSQSRANKSREQYLQGPSPSAFINREILVPILEAVKPSTQIILKQLNLNYNLLNLHISFKTTERTRRQYI